MRMRSDRYHDIFVQKIPIFYDTAISSMATRYCQDPYYSDRLIPGEHEMACSKKIPIFYYTAINLLQAHTMY